MVVLFSFVLGFAIVTATKKVKDSECLELGFISHQLSCSTCDEMAAFEKLSTHTELLEKCRACCTESQTNDMVYDEAVLRLTERAISAFPQIGGFVKHHIMKYPAIKVQWVTYGYPTLVLYKGGNTRGVEKIWSWNEDQIRSFADFRLDNAAAKAAGADHSATFVLPSKRKSRTENAGLSDDYLDILFPPELDVKSKKKDDVKKK